MRGANPLQTPQKPSARSPTTSPPLPYLCSGAQEVACVGVTEAIERVKVQSPLRIVCLLNVRDRLRAARERRFDVSRSMRAAWRSAAACWAASAIESCPSLRLTGPSVPVPLPSWEDLVALPASTEFASPETEHRKAARRTVAVGCARIP